MNTLRRFTRRQRATTVVSSLSYVSSSCLSPSSVSSSAKPAPYAEMCCSSYSYGKRNHNIYLESRKDGFTDEQLAEISRFKTRMKQLLLGNDGYTVKKLRLNKPRRKIVF